MNIFWLPMMFIFGMIGLCCMFAGPMIMVYKIHEKEYYEGFRLGLIITVVGFALFIAWLY